MSSIEGRFTWYELMTTDTKAAAAFYGDVVGWGTQDASMPGTAYTLFTAGAAPVSGLMELPGDARRMGVPPSWVGYVSVDDVDATADRVQRLGGAVHLPPRDIPNIGRFAVIADPQAAGLALFSPLDSYQGPSPAPGTPGCIGWHELLATDWEGAFAFYAELFGWRKADAVDIGEMGTYQLFSAGGQTIGGMFTKPPTVPAPFWLYYINVGDIDAAVERVRAGDGRILNGPMQVPGGDWIIQGMDPQGAMFALAGQRGQSAKA